MTDTELKALKNKLENITNTELYELSLLLHRTFNFINTLENMSIKEIQTLQAEEIHTNIVMTSKILRNECIKLLSLDIE